MRILPAILALLFACLLSTLPGRAQTSELPAPGVPPEVVVAPADPSGTILPAVPADCGEDGPTPGTCEGGKRFHAEAEYLLWWLREGRVPPLLTTGPASSATSPGILGGQDTRILYGNGRLETRHG